MADQLTRDHADGARLPDPSPSVSQQRRRDWSGWRDKAAWQEIQTRFAHLEGEGGVRERAQAYAPFFQGFGKDVRISAGCFFSSPWRIVLDDGVRINRDAIIEGSSGVRIGRNARIGHRLFLHSANHLIDPPDGLAHFERRYVYRPVVIDDNVLVSANVTILPGARLGAGSFVAAGAVVTGRVWPDGGRLMGVPAIDKANRAKPAAATQGILIAIAAEQEDVADFRRLAAATRLAGVAVIGPGEAWPASARVVLDARASGSAPLEAQLLGEGAAPSMWRLARSTDASTLGDDAWLPEGLRRRRMLSARNGHGEIPSLAASGASTLYAAWNYAVKGQPATISDRRRWLALELASELAEPQARPAWAGLFAQLGPLDALPPSGSAGTAPGAAWMAAAREAARSERPIGLAFSDPSGTRPALCRAGFLAEPELLPLLARSQRDADQSFCRELLHLIRSHANTADRMAGVGLVAAILGLTDVHQEIARELASPAWCVEGGACVLAKPGHPAASRSPMVAACLLAAALREDPDADVGFLDRRQQPLAWPAVAQAGASSDTLRGRLVDLERRTIRWEMFENWRLLCRAPDLGHRHVVIDDDAYGDAPGLIEQVWRDTLADALAEAGAPAVIVEPWPDGFDFALSLRFDVDRPVPAAQLKALIDIQKRHLGAPAGSWYFIDGAAHNEAVRNVLKHWNQEYAHHGVAAAAAATDGEALAGRGVTMHSSGRSEYWRGAATIEGAARAGAAYAESMMSLHALPQLHGARDGATDDAARLWLTPLHFPLEGSTGERDTRYFWRRREALLRQAGRGGHVIIGTHPDCDEAVLDAALREMSPRRAWAAPVGLVVDRVDALFAPGALAVRARPNHDATIELTPARCAADVVLRLRWPGETEWTRHVVQLQAGASRTIGRG